MYNAVGSTYTQDFNTLPFLPSNTSLVGTATGEWQDDTTTPAAGHFSLLGVYLYSILDPGGTGPENGFNSHQRFRITTSASTTGSFYSTGPASNAERALGAIASNTTGDQYLGLRLTNNTGNILASFTLSYDGEQWRDGGAATPNAQSLLFEYKVTPSGAGPALQDAGFTPVPALNFTSPVFAHTGGGAAVDGNVAGKVSIGPVTVSGVAWLPGTDLWLRWFDDNDVGNDHHLAIDNISISAVTPEPVSALVWACLAMIGVGAARRWR
jgi:hypothetical protein